MKAKKRGGGFTKICQLSPQLDKFLGTSQLARTEVTVIFFFQDGSEPDYLCFCFTDILYGEWFQVVKMMWKYIKENNLQDPKDGRKILCDEQLHSLFRVKSINMFQMNKALSKHIWPLGDANGIFPLS